MIDLSGKIALVTGASRGIGAAIAKAYAKAGAHVILVARTVGALEEVDDEIQSFGASATLLPMDLLKHDEIDLLGASIFERFGGLDILLGNAGMLGPLTPVHQVTPQEWDKVMNLNFMANVRLIRILDPLLRASSAGRAIFITSGQVHNFDAYKAPYTASKAALESVVKTYAAETMKTNLKINLVDPGAVETDILADAYPGGYQGEVKKPEDVAETVLGLSSNQCTSHGDVVKV